MSKGIFVKLDEIGISVYICIKSKRTSIMPKKSSEPKSVAKEESRTTSHPYPSLGRPNIQSQKEEEKEQAQLHVPCPPSSQCMPARPKKSARAAFFRFRSRNQTMGSSDATRKDVKQTPKSTLGQTISCTLRTPTSPSSPPPRHPPLHGRSRPRSQDSSS